MRGLGSDVEAVGSVKLIAAVIHIDDPQAGRLSFFRPALPTGGKVLEVVEVDAVHEAGAAGFDHVIQEIAVEVLVRVIGFIEILVRDAAHDHGIGGVDALEPGVCPLQHLGVLLSVLAVVLQAIAAAVRWNGVRLVEDLPHVDVVVFPRKRFEEGVIGLHPVGAHNITGLLAFLGPGRHARNGGDNAQAGVIDFGQALIVERPVIIRVLRRLDAGPIDVQAHVAGAALLDRIQYGREGGVQLRDQLFLHLSGLGLRELCKNRAGLNLAYAGNLDGKRRRFGNISVIDQRQIDGASTLRPGHAGRPCAVQQRGHCCKHQCCEHHPCKHAVEKLHCSVSLF